MADVVAHTGLSVDEIVAIHSRAALPGVRARQPPGLLLPRRHGPAHRDAAAQGAGAQDPGRRGLDRRRADRRVGLGRAERLEHDRHDIDDASSTRRAIRRRCCSPATASLPRRRGDPMIEILSQSALATVQDLGRFGALRWGVGTAGAMDRLALACGNLLLGNDEGAAAIEVQVFPFEARFDGGARVRVDRRRLRGDARRRPLLPWWSVQRASRRGAPPRAAAERPLAGRPRLPLRGRRHRRARRPRLAQHAAARRVRRARRPGAAAGRQAACRHGPPAHAARRSESASCRPASHCR